MSRSFNDFVKAPDRECFRQSREQNDKNLLYLLTQRSQMLAVTPQTAL